ncbi:hypothetical protein [Streptomyces sp. TP-A0356]|uniref:hypothetical protein n=1 Tax=Streptomyces sp. TP-A0356 TaxID=1359208 RepID=UPI00131E5016|nr:hypothetical protein [Streptomyces sp. TP-A0356]
MRRFILPIAAILLTAACGPGAMNATPSPAHASSQQPAESSHSAAVNTPSASHSAKSNPSRSASPKECPSVGDVILWMKVPGVPDSAQVLGGNGYPNCESTFDMVQRTSPNVPGACTEAAWASDNPGYNADATPAKRLKKVQVAVGPAC